MLWDMPTIIISPSGLGRTSGAGEILLVGTFSASQLRAEPHLLDRPVVGVVAFAKRIGFTRATTNGLRYGLSNPSP